MPNPHIIVDTNEIRMTDDDGAPSLHILRPSYLGGEEYFWFPLSRIQRNRQAVNNSTVLVNSELSIPVRAGSVVSIDAVINLAQPDYTATTIAEKFRLSAPSGSTGAVMYVRSFAVRGDNDVSADSGLINVNTDINTPSEIGQFGEEKAYSLRGHATIGGTDGNITIQFAQNSAVSANLWMMEGSWIRVQRVA